MKNDIRWIHLSDLHFGSPKNIWLDTTIQDRLIEKISNMGRIDFIIISGDIIHQGQYNNAVLKEKALNFIQKLKGISNEIVFSAGNHDYSRDECRFDILAKWQKEPNKNLKENEYNDKLASSFNCFVDFCKTATHTEHPIKIGSYIYELEDINVIILNTSIFSGQPVQEDSGNFSKDENGNIMVNDYQKLWMCKSELPDYSKIRKHLPTIVAGHHPFQMFSDDSQKDLKLFMDNISATYYFCGHIHDNCRSNFSKIKQLAGAGLFTGKNVPSFSLNIMQKKSNSNIYTHVYVYDNEGDWDEINKPMKKNEEDWNEVNKSMEKNIVSSNSTGIEQEKLFHLTKNDISEGAVRMPCNEGMFNLYISSPKFTDIITPHSHEKVDEVAFVTQGSLFAYLNEEVLLLNKNDAIIMPKNALHAFICKEQPCEFITIGMETTEKTSYESDWKQDIETLNELNSKLIKDIEVTKITPQICEYFKASIMEVRLQAIKIINDYLNSKHDDENIQNVKSTIQLLVSQLLDSNNIQDKLIGLNIAYEFSTTVSKEKISQILIFEDCFLLPWNCMYYILKVNPYNINFRSLYNKNKSKEYDISIKNSSKYNRLALLAILELIYNHKDDLIVETSKLFLNCNDCTIPFNHILIYFFTWYICNSPQKGEINYNLLKGNYLNDQIPEEDKIIRVLLDRQNPSKIFSTLIKLDNLKSLTCVIIGYLTCFKEPQNSETIDHKNIRDNIKKYLRIIVSEKCNLNCAYCHHEGRSKFLIGNSISDNPDFNLKRLLEEAHNNKFKKIKISGGEPLLYPEILNICNEFQSRFDDIGFTTNGTKICALKDDFDKIKGSKLNFNVTLNSVDQEHYAHITGQDLLQDVLMGIDYLVKNKFKVKLNSVITSYNFDEIENLIAYAARKNVDIKLLDLFTLDSPHDDFQRVSIVEIKNKIMTLYDKEDKDFYIEKDYLCVKVMGIRVQIPQRVYCYDCQYNCDMYPCAEGLFGIRVYEDYSCARCFKGDIKKGDIDMFNDNIEEIRQSLDSVCFSY